MSSSQIIYNLLSLALTHSLTPHPPPPLSPFSLHARVYMCVCVGVCMCVCVCVCVLVCENKNLDPQITRLVIKDQFTALTLNPIRHKMVVVMPLSRNCQPGACETVK